MSFVEGLQSGRDSRFRDTETERQRREEALRLALNLQAQKRQEKLAAANRDEDIQREMVTRRGDIDRAMGIRGEDRAREQEWRGEDIARNLGIRDEDLAREQEWRGEDLGIRAEDRAIQQDERAMDRAQREREHMEDIGLQMRTRAEDRAGRLTDRERLEIQLAEEDRKRQEKDRNILEYAGLLAREDAQIPEHPGEFQFAPPPIMSEDELQRDIERQRAIDLRASRGVGLRVEHPQAAKERALARQNVRFEEARKSQEVEHAEKVRARERSKAAAAAKQKEYATRLRVGDQPWRAKSPEDIEAESAARTTGRLSAEQQVVIESAIKAARAGDKTAQDNLSRRGISWK